MSGLRIVFETHSTTLDNESGHATGWNPGQLSALGREQAVELGVRVGERGPIVILCSDLRRARQTVELAVRDHDVTVLYDWRLRECNYGRLNGAPRSVVLGDQLLAHLHQPYPQGESWAEALDRVEEALTDYRRRWPQGPIMIIGHVATRWALQRRTRRVTLAELAAESFSWQPGWEFRIR